MQVYGRQYVLQCTKLVDGWCIVIDLLFKILQYVMHVGVTILLFVRKAQMLLNSTVMIQWCS